MVVKQDDKYSYVCALINYEDGSTIKPQEF